MNRYLESFVASKTSRKGRMATALRAIQVNYAPTTCALWRGAALLVLLSSAACSSPTSPTPAGPTITLQSITPSFGATITLPGPGCIDPGCTYLNQITIVASAANLPSVQFSVAIDLFAGSSKCWTGVSRSFAPPSVVIDAFTKRPSAPGTCGNPQAGSTSFLRGPAVSIDRLHVSAVALDGHPLAEQDVVGGWRIEF